GQQYVQVASVSAVQGKSIAYNSSVVVANGDVWVAPLNTTEDACQVTMLPTGEVGVAANGVTRRQSGTFNCYSVSAQAMIGAASVYFNDLAPIAPAAVPVLYGVFVGANQTLNLAANTLATDPQGDTPTVALSGLPTGLTQTGQAITGQSSNNRVTVITGTWSNNSGDSTTGTFNLVEGVENLPNLVGL